MNDKLSNIFWYTVLFYWNHFLHPKDSNLALLKLYLVVLFFTNRVPLIFQNALKYGDFKCRGSESIWFLLILNLEVSFHLDIFQIKTQIVQLFWAYFQSSRELSTSFVYSDCILLNQRSLKLTSQKKKKKVLKLS